jgi:hypothetical protein
MNSNISGSQLTLLEEMTPRFGSGFLKDHAGKILTNPRIAIVELVANCWDAGADLVDITWPENYGENVIIKDNGIGMTYSDFINRWNEFSYNRLEHQGPDVLFPPKNKRSSRKAFGRNGKGRHGMFCFSNEYKVETFKDGQKNIFKVHRSENFTTPFKIIWLGKEETSENGVMLSARLDMNHLQVADVKDLIGSKFVADPAFKIVINDELVELTDLEHLSVNYDLPINSLGTVKIRHFDTRKTGRTSKQHGVAWWVNKRLVGEASWKGFDDNPYLDARRSEAKRHTFVVEADMLENSVEPDWDGFKDTPEFNAVSEKVKDFILDRLQEIFSDLQKIRKIEAISSNRSEVKELDPGSRKVVGSFVDELQRISPTITQKDLNATVEILTKLEKSRSQYTLLEQLAKLDPNDLDNLSEILSKWTVNETKLVMDELGKRLKLIESLEKLVENPLADELHDIQPLFEGGLWIFGPEYESVEFISNKSLASVIRDFFHEDEVKLSTPKRRPDIVTLPDSTISIYSADAFDDRSEVSGYSRILIIELKKGGFTLTTKERRQGEDYASELRKSGKVNRDTKIIGFVLGDRIDDDAIEPSVIGNTTIYTRPYSVVLRQAHARTFNLLEKMKKIRDEAGIEDFESDPEIEMILNQPQQMELILEKNIEGQG